MRVHKWDQAQVTMPPCQHLATAHRHMPGKLSGMLRTKACLEQCKRAKCQTLAAPTCITLVS